MRPFEPAPPRIQRKRTHGRERALPKCNIVLYRGSIRRNTTAERDAYRCFTNALGFFSGCRSASSRHPVGEATFLSTCQSDRLPARPGRVLVLSFSKLNPLIVLPVVFSSKKKNLLLELSFWPFFSLFWFFSIFLGLKFEHVRERGSVDGCFPARAVNSVLEVTL